MTKDEAIAIVEHRIRIGQVRDNFPVTPNREFAEQIVEDLVTGGWQPSDEDPPKRQRK